MEKPPIRPSPFGRAFGEIMREPPGKTNPFKNKYFESFMEIRNTLRYALENDDRFKQYSMEKHLQRLAFGLANTSEPIYEDSTVEETLRIVLWILADHEKKLIFQRYGCYSRF